MAQNMLERLKEWLFGKTEEKKKEDEKTKEKEAIYETRKLSKQSNSYYINIPKKWFKKNNLDPEEIEDISMLANSDILIINPNRSDEIRKKFEKKTFEIYEEEKKST